jgi:holin-like protein
MLHIVFLFGQLIVLWAIYWLGSQIQLILQIPIPGTVIGMVLLFSFLSLGIVKIQWIEQAADLLLKHMLFFFIPIAVGLMNWGTLFYNNAIVLTIAVVIGAVLPYWVVGHLIQLFHRSKNKCNN